METPAPGEISSSTLRVTPSRHPDESGGMQAAPPFTKKIFAEVHSATSPRLLSKITSVQPAFCASARCHTLFSHEVVFTPARGEAECLPFSATPSRACSECGGSPACHIIKSTSGTPPPLCQNPTRL